MRAAKLGIPVENGRSARVDVGAAMTGLTLPQVLEDQRDAIHGAWKV